MNRDDLLKLLDLGAEDDAVHPTEELSITSPDTSPTNLTALDLDDWAARRGREVLAESDRLRSLDLGEHAVADFFGCAFEPEPRLHEACADPRRHAFITQMLETPEYRSLHTSTLLNALASSIATVAFAEQFAKLGKEEPTGKDPVEREMQVLRAVGRALAEATEEVEEAREASSALGMGPGSPAGNDPRAIAALYRRVRNDPTLRRICELAGRYRWVAQSRQRRKLAHGSDDVVGVVLDGDLGRVLPHELARLAIPEFEDDTLRRLVERQLTCRETRSTEPVAKGPIIVTVDESGSMGGEKGHTAKALALALAWIARRQRRTPPGAAAGPVGRVGARGLARRVPRPRLVAGCPRARDAALRRAAPRPRGGHRPRLHHRRDVPTADGPPGRVQRLEEARTGEAHHPGHPRYAGRPDDDLRRGASGFVPRRHRAGCRACPVHLTSTITFMARRAERTSVSPGLPRFHPKEYLS